MVSMKKRQGRGVRFNRWDLWSCSSVAYFYSLFTLISQMIVSEWLNNSDENKFRQSMQIFQKCCDGYFPEVLLAFDDTCYLSWNFLWICIISAARNICYRNNQSPGNAYIYSAIKDLMLGFREWKMNHFDLIDLHFMSYICACLKR